MRHPEDIIYWPDEDTWCYRDELWEMSHMGDDYSVIPFESTWWNQFVDQKINVNHREEWEEYNE